MLNTIRNNKDNLLLKLLFSFIVFSFLGAGFIAMFTDALWGKNSDSVVIFSKTDNISFEEYAKQRANDLKRLQTMSGENWDQEKLEEIGFNKMLLQKLISKSMIEYLAEAYNLSIGEDTIVRLLTKDPNFQDENGNFDKSRFKALFQNGSITEEEYIDFMQNNLASSLLVNIFADSFTEPAIMVDNMTKPMAEKLSFSIYSVDLTNKPKGYRPVIIDDAKIKKYYDENLSLFTLPELRKVNYLVFDQKLMKKRLKISNAEINEYYQDNKDELTSKNVAKAKKEARDLLERTKLEELQIELANELERFVSDGFSIEEIAEKYNLKVKVSKMLSKQALINGQDKTLQPIANEVFELAEEELGYPIETSDENKIYLASVSSIVQPRLQTLDEVKRTIAERFNAEILAQENYAKLNKFYQDFQGTQPKKADMNKYGVKQQARQSVQRAELAQDTKLPTMLLQQIVYARAKDKTKIVVDGNKAYFAYVKETKLDKGVHKKIKESAKLHLATNIKQSIMQDLIDYLIKENDMKLNLPETSDRQ